MEARHMETYQFIPCLTLQSHCIQTEGNFEFILSWTIMTKAFDKTWWFKGLHLSMQ